VRGVGRHCSQLIHRHVRNAVASPPSTNIIQAVDETCNCFDLCDIILFVNHNSNNASKAQCIVTQNPGVSNHAERH
jgi:hypothetical protein